MPTVPVYDSFQVAPQAMPDARVADVQPGNSALQVGQSLEQAGGAALDIAARIQHRADADSVMRAEASLKDSYLQFENGVRQRRGQEAWGVTNDTTQWWDKNSRTIGDGLQNDQQRSAFGRIAMGLREQSLNTVSVYENQQQHQSIEDSANASIKGSIDLAAANAIDPQALSQAKSTILGRVDAVGKLNGYTPEMYDAARTEQLTKLHTQVIQSLVDKDPTQAQAYLDANRGEIAGSQLDTLDKAVRVGTVVDQSQKAAADLFNRHPGDESAQLSDARKTLSGPVLDATVTRLKEQNGEQDQIRERNQRQAADKGWQILTRGGGYSAIPPSLLNSMSGETVKALQDEAARRAKGDDVKTDPGTFYDLRLMAGQSPDQFAKIDLRNYLSKLAPPEFKQLTDIQANVQKGGGNDVQTVNEQLGRAHDLLGWTDSDRVRKGQFDTAALAAIDAEQKANGGKKLAYDATQKIIDRMMINGSYQGGSWFSTGSPFYQVAGTENEASFKPNIPDVERQKIEAALTRAKQPITDDVVMKLYKLKTGLK